MDKAVSVCTGVQVKMKLYNKRKSEWDRIEVCAGIGYGDVLLIGQTDVFGAEVNFASKLGEDLAEAFEIYATEAAWGGMNPQNQLMFKQVNDIMNLETKAYKMSDE